MESAGRQWLSVRREELDGGSVERIVAAICRLRPSDDTIGQMVEKERDYFYRNAVRMRYAEFRRQHLFVGSGVAEAGL